MKSPSKSAAYYLFSHGLADTNAQAYRYKEHDVVDNPLTTFDYPDATTRFWRVNFWRTSFGQDNEIETLKRAHQTQQQQMNGAHTSDAPVVLFGLSRGAATALNFVAQNKPSNIKAMVLESPYDHVSSIAKHLAQQFHVSSFKYASELIHYLMSLLFFRYNHHGIQPIHSIQKISKDMPVLIICSKQDQLVPWKSSVKLYNKLRKAGHQHAHILILDHGKHAKILSEKDGNIYRSVVHAFYQKYELPHNPEFASLGKETLDQML